MQGTGVDGLRRRNEAIVEGLRSGRTMEEVAEEHYLAPSSIRRIAASYGVVKYRRLKREAREARNAEILRLAGEGRTYISLDEEFGLSRGQCSKICRDAGMPNRSAPSIEYVRRVRMERREARDALERKE